MNRLINLRATRALLFVGSVGLFQACGEDDPVAPASITVSITPTSGSTGQGGNVTIPVTVTGSGGYSGTPAITVQDAPTGVTSSVSTVTTSGATSTATVTLNVASTVPPGDYPITIVASGTGVLAKSATYTLTVTGQPGIVLSATPATLTLAPGANATTTINLARTSFTSPVTLAVEGLPAGVTADFAPTPATAGTSTLTLTAGAGATAGTYNLTIRGTGTGITDATLPFVLTIS
jgi:uncharacterized membrane protein